MPANLSQQYRNAEKKYRRADTVEEELECLELMLREIPKHKGTDKLQADLKRRISQTRAKVETNSSRKSTPGFRIPRQGAARIVLLGPSNSGKSSLFNTMTGSDARVAEFPFSTTQPQPALTRIEKVKLQLIDTPPVDFAEFDSRTESLIRGADLVLLLAPAGDDEGIDRFLKAIHTVQKSRTRLAMTNSIDEEDIGVTYTRTMLVWTFADDKEFLSRQKFFRELLQDNPVRDFLPGSDVSALSGQGMQSFEAQVFERLELVRIFTKNPGRPDPDLSDPVALPKGSNVMDLANELHEELAANFSQARIWGDGKHDGTIVNGEYQLEDLDIVEIKTR